MAARWGWGGVCDEGSGGSGGGGGGGGLRERGLCFALPEVTYPWTVSCLEYGIAR